MVPSEEGKTSGNRKLTRFGRGNRNWERHKEAKRGEKSRKESDESNEDNLVAVIGENAPLADEWEAIHVDEVLDVGALGELPVVLKYYVSLLCDDDSRDLVNLRCPSSGGGSKLVNEVNREERP